MSTVSNVLNDKRSSSIAEDVKQRVHAAVSDLGYVRNAAGATLRRGHSNVVLIASDDTFVSDAFARELASTARQLTQADRIVLTYAVADERQLLEVVTTTRPRAVALFTLTSHSTRARLADLGVVHIIGVGSVDDPEAAERPWEMQIGQAQAIHLISRGLRRLVIGMPDSDDPRLLNAVHRARGVRTAAEAHEVAVEEVVIPLDRDRSSEVVHALLQDGRPLGLCACDDVHALSALAAAHDLGIDVPRQIAVVGVDDTVHGRLATPALSTVRLPDLPDNYVAQWLGALEDGGLAPLNGIAELRVEVVQRGTS